MQVRGYQGVAAWGNVKIGEIISEGGTGVVYKAKDEESNDVFVVKIRKKDAKKYNKPKGIYKEAIIIDLLSEKGYFPKSQLIAKSDTFINKAILALPNLGVSLWDSLKKSGIENFPIPFANLIMMQVIDRLEELHSCHYTHRDIKPHNLCISLDETFKVSLIDFGLASKYIKDSGEHRIKSPGRGFVGTCRFASSSAHEGNSPCRKDDLESAGYVWIWMVLGKLPWQQLNIPDRSTKHEILAFRKKKFKASTVVHSEEIENYFEAINALMFEECPNYGMLKDIFSCNLMTGNDLRDFVDNLKLKLK